MRVSLVKARGRRMLVRGDCLVALGLMRKMDQRASIQCSALTSTWLRVRGPVNSSPECNWHSFPGCLRVVVERYGSGTAGDRTKGANLGACQIRFTIRTVVPRGAHAVFEGTGIRPTLQPGLRVGGVQQRRDPGMAHAVGKIRRSAAC